MEFVFLDEGRRYGSNMVSLGGEDYAVRHEGTRDLINVPEKVNGVSSEIHLKPHNWIPVGKADAELVERAAQAAIRKNDEEIMAKQAAAFNAKPEEISQVRKGH